MLSDSQLDAPESLEFYDIHMKYVVEPGEFEIVNIPGAVLIPKGRILDGSALAEMPHDKPIILHCKSGVRSAECLAALKGAGFADATHVAFVKGDLEQQIALLKIVGRMAIDVLESS